MSSYDVTAHAMTLERVESNQTKEQSQKMSSSLYGTYADLSKLTSIEEDEDDQQEEEEENFVLTSLLEAADEGNIDAVEELLNNAPELDFSVSNRHGETALHFAAGSGHLDMTRFLLSKGADLKKRDMHGDEPIYWAARQGNVAMVHFLKEQGASLDTQNKSGESTIHVAVRYGHVDVIEYLSSSGANVNLQDKQGDIALHTAAWHGLPADICRILCSSGSNMNTKNKEDEAPIHLAAGRANVDCLKVLLSHGASIDILDKRGCTALHLACRRRHVQIAKILLNAGCQLDIADQIGEMPLHAACREGLLPVVQMLCTFGCKVDVVNKVGMSPLHLAAKLGHTEIVRCLLLSGACLDLPNKDGITAEIMALAQGQNDSAELLAKLRPDRQELFIKQLLPASTPINRPKLKVFGSSGVGKTMLIESLKCGILGSLLRKAGIGGGAPNSNLTPNSTRSKENGHRRRQTLQTQLSFERTHDGYTQGIDVQQVNLTGAGDMSIWEFSGYEPYFMLYDHFIGDPNCIHMVVFNAADPQDVQMTQLLIWLNFIKARMQPMEPIGYSGRLSCQVQVVLVATQADRMATSPSGSREELDECSEFSVLLETMRQKFDADLNIYQKIYVVDCNIPMSPQMKGLRSLLTDMKSSICQGLPTSNGFLDATVAALPGWRRVLASYPVVNWPSFTEYIRSTVNLLASEEHLKELMCQLQLIGEVVYVETNEEIDDLVVLSPRWLCGNVIGHLLSHEVTTTCRPTGCFVAEDFQMLFPDCEAEDLLLLLEALEVSTRCDLDGEVEYELPCLNFVETLSGLWDREDLRLSEDTIYGGVRLIARRGARNQLMHLFPRIQVRLRRDFLLDRNNPENDLYQWYHGSKYCQGSLEVLLTLEQEEQAIELKCRGPSNLAYNLYNFSESICEVVFSVVEDSCPSITLERHLLSARQLAEHQCPTHAYIPKDVLYAQRSGHDVVSFNTGTGTVSESLIDLVAYGSEEIFASLKSGLALHVSNLPLNARRQLCSMLDPTDPLGRDWCLLAISLGLSEELPTLDSKDNPKFSRTDKVLALWSRDPNAIINILIDKLLELGRNDAVDMLLSSALMFRYFQPEEESSRLQMNSEPAQNELLS